MCNWFRSLRCGDIPPAQAPAPPQKKDDLRALQEKIDKLQRQLEEALQAERTARQLAEVARAQAEAAALDALAALAAQAYGAPSAAHVVPAPGTQILLYMVAALVPPGRAAVLGPTYAEHVRVAALVGHRATEVAEVGGLADADLAIVVNPNNPDGRIVGRETLLSLAERQKRRGGLLVVDEAFMDVASPDASLGGHVAHESIVVLRSFGKFYGLAGVPTVGAAA